MADGSDPGDEWADLGDESVSELVQRASRQTADLIRQEIQLAQVELKEKGRRIGVGAGMMGAGGLVAVYGGATLVAAAVVGLATALEWWLAALIGGVTLVVIGGILALMGRREAVEALPPTPEHAMASVRDDVQHIKERTGR
jgi:uncharacterized membrane protein YqjE